MIALNRAVAVAEVEGPAAALALVDELDLGNYYLFHAIRAALLKRLDRREEAAAAYDGRDLTDNSAERTFLEITAKPSRVHLLAVDSAGSLAGWSGQYWSGPINSKEIP